MKRVLIVAAHPDDEVLGCGGTAARLIKNNYEIFTLILGEGITSRDYIKNIENRKKEIDELKHEIKQANKIIGIKNVFTFDFPDNRFDTIALLDIVKAIEKIKNEVNPEIIFTHYEKDLNIDHKITFNAVMTGTRPFGKEIVKEIYSFEIPSSTEWNCPLSFSPDVFFDIDNTLECKLKAIEAYKTELKEFPHPRSIEGIKRHAKYWGICVGLNQAEAFKSIRVIK